jgi:hypothetical protein
MKKSFLFISFFVCSLLVSTSFSVGRKSPTYSEDSNSALLRIRGLSSNKKKSSASEIVESRTPSSKKFLLPSGESETSYYNEPVHYWDGHQFQEFDNSITEKGGYLTNLSSNYVVKFKKTLGNPRVVTINYAGVYEISITEDLSSFSSSWNTEGINPSFVSKKTERGNYDELTNQVGTVAYDLGQGAQSVSRITALGFEAEIDAPKNLARTPRSFLISTSLGMYKADDGFVFVDKNGIDIFGFGGQSFIDNDGLMSSMNTNLESLGKNQYFLSVSPKASGDNSSALSTKSIVSVSFQLSLQNKAISDKYYIIGENGSFDNSFLHVGQSQVGILGPNDVAFYPQYRSILDIQLNSSSNSSDVASALLSLSVYSGNTTSPKLRRITSNIAYSDIDGASSYLMAGPILSTGTTTKTFDITSDVITALAATETSICYELDGYFDSTSETVFYSSNGAINCPSFTIINQQNPNPTSQVGAATPYVPVNLPSINCFGYATNINEFLQLKYPNDSSISPTGTASQTTYSSVFVPAAMSRLTERNISFRIVQSYNSLIYAYERKIAFRIGCFATGAYKDFHWMRQLDSGDWSQKHGGLPSELLGAGLNPETGNWNKGSYIYDSPTTYFAIN